MAANGNSTKNTETKSTETKSTESTEVKEKDAQILFKVSPTQRDELRVVAMLERKSGFQDLFASVAAELINKHRAKLDDLFETAA